MFKRYTAIAIYEINDDTHTVEIIPNNGKHWKELLSQTYFFSKDDDDLSWVSDEFNLAVGQLLKNGISIAITHYDKINQQTKRRQVDNGKL